VAIVVTGLVEVHSIAMITTWVIAAVEAAVVVRVAIVAAVRSC